MQHFVSKIFNLFSIFDAEQETIKLNFDFISIFSLIFVPRWRDNRYIIDTRETLRLAPSHLAESYLAYIRGEAYLLYFAV